MKREAGSGDYEGRTLLPTRQSRFPLPASLAVTRFPLPASLFPRSVLQALSARLGILPRYVDVAGREHITPADTAVAILAAMGIDASTDHAARAALRRLDDAEQRRILEPVRVVLDADAWQSTLRFRVPAEFGPPNERHRIAYECTLTDEHQERVTYAGAVEQVAGDVVDVGLAPLVGAGYYDARLTLQSRGVLREAEQRLVVAPRACVTPARPAFGITANLYSVRSATNWSVGTLADLATLAEWSASHGAAFVGINPLHALRNRGYDISPYSPVSRLYRSAAYLDIDSVPELAESDAARALLSRDDVRAALAQLRAGDRVDYERATTLARPVLHALHRAFMARAAGDARRAAYDRYVAEQGDALTAFATFSALDESFAPIASWREWPAAYRTPSSAAVAEFRTAHREQVDFHRWIQFELDRQLRHAAERGRRAGLSIGIYQDLAIGSSSDGSDAWACQHLFLDGLTIGAPPDALAPEGQNWGLPPISPHRLHDDRYAYWIALLRAALRHGGALRLDHVLGLFRQFWIPAGRPERDGAYVRFPTNDLLGILALESARHRAVILCEDLGTLPPEFAPTLGALNIHGSSVLLFEVDADG